MQQWQNGTLEQEPKLTSGPPFLSDLILSHLSHLIPTHHSAPSTLGSFPLLRPTQQFLLPQGLCTGSSLCLECSTPGGLIAHSLTHVWYFYVTFSVRLSLNIPYKTSTLPLQYFLPIPCYNFSSTNHHHLTIYISRFFVYLFPH